MVESPALTHYDESMQRQTRIIEQAKKGIKVVRGRDRPFEINRQGIVRSYADNYDLQLANNNWNIFCHEIRQHSGRHRHQGGINLFIIKGRGYTVVDGQKYEW